MAETLTFTAPQQIAPPSATVKVMGFEMFTEPTPFVRVVLKDENGKLIEHYYREADGALALIVSLNKANLTVKSLQRRIIEKLQTDGKLAAGAISGAPD